MMGSGEEVGGVGKGEIGEPPSDDDEDDAADPFHVGALGSDGCELVIGCGGEGDRRHAEREDEGCCGDGERRDAGDDASGDGRLTCQTGKEWPGSTEPSEDEAEPVKDVGSVFVAIGESNSSAVDRFGKAAQSPQRGPDDTELHKSSGEDDRSDGAS